MASPSPLDLCWKVKDTPGSSPILPALRAAVEKHWPETLRNAAWVLCDETLPAEIMEAAIEKAVAYLVRAFTGDHGRCKYSSLAILQRRDRASAQGTEQTGLY